MSDDKTFLARWSRRKREAAPDTREQPKPENAGGGAASRASAASLLPGETHPLFDPASLPPIESIVAGSDISAFLAAGAPADIARAALRRVWSSDPMIRDFVGLSENSWDFNVPGAMPGFGPIDRKEVARLVTRLWESRTPQRLRRTRPRRRLRRISTRGIRSGRESRPILGLAGPVPAPDQQPQQLDTTSVTNDVTQRREAVPASQHESSSGDQRQITARLGQGSALPR
jgi:hypothetical protein